MSSAVITAATPLRASARDVSMLRMSAWGWGLRRMRASSIPGSTTSVV